MYLKHGTGRVAEEVFDEALRLRWLGRHVPVPPVRLVIASTESDRAAGAGRTLVVASGQDDGTLQLSRPVTHAHDEETWLLMDALPGRTAYEVLEASTDTPNVQRAVVDALVAFLRRVHAIPVETCPFITDHHRRLVHARERLEAGVVDEDDFGAQHDGWTAHEVWNAMVALLPLDVDQVVTHGDFSLDNVLLADRGAAGGFEVVCCLDAGRVGVADRYQDLAILSDCLGEFGEALQSRLFTQYGVDAVDETKLRFHLALDEFF
ncbi:MAG: aminoglycoside 3'-phosphotransferase [Gemmatimonadaceae bacterium]|nr:aminoglycoside 3'-phosphotransferase [Gemmatimonadaceae bacterium]